MSLFGGKEKDQGRQTLPRGYDRRSERPHEARWFDPKGFAKGWEFKDAQGRVSGIFLGRSEGKLLGQMDNRHMLTVAGSRGGKGESLIKPNLWFYEGSMVVMDPKGELARDTSARRGRMGQRVVILDPFRSSGIQVDHGWNPLEEINIDADEGVDDALMIADAMVELPPRGEKHWAEAAQSLIQALILATKLLPLAEDERDLCTARDLLMCRHELVRVLAHEKNISPTKALFHLLTNAGDIEAAKHEEGPRRRVADLVRGIGITYADMDSRELESVLSTARTQSRFLESDALQRVLRQHSLKLANIKREPTTVYLCLPARRMATHAKWLRIMVNMAVSAFEGGPVPEIPVVMLLDEFPVLGKMHSLEVAAGLLAGSGVKLWIVVQDLTQLQAIYEKSWETFVGNAGVLTFFANNDSTTLQYVSERLGERTMVVQEPGNQTPGGGFAGAGETQDKLRDQALLSPSEVRMYFDREAEALLVMTPRHPPVFMDRVVFHKHRELFQG